MTATKNKISPYGSINFLSIDEYHSSFQKDIQKILQQLRQAIKQVAPNAIETISYNIPTFKQNKNLVHYAAYKGHIGFYPTSKPLTVFKEELVKFKTSKGAIQFPINEPLPINLIKQIVKFRLTEDNEIALKRIDSSNKKTLRTCKNGHQYYKSSDCPTCSTCEEIQKPKDGFLSLLCAPARRALEHANIRTLKQLSKFSENDVLKLHGIGKTTIPILKRALENAGLMFNN